MDLPTYTSIWRIEKRLYKLYDFRLPMPLPIGQLTVFAAVTIPYVLILQLLGLPFNHTLIWLYILPPAVVTWLATRPVLESKRLPELVKSQLGYLAEPKVICRMAPLAERDVVMVTGRVWRPRTRRADAAPAAEIVAADGLGTDVLGTGVLDVDGLAVDGLAADGLAADARAADGLAGAARYRQGLTWPPELDRDAAPAGQRAFSQDGDSDDGQHGAEPGLAAATAPAGRRRRPCDHRLMAEALTDLLELIVVVDPIYSQNCYV
ncbi:MAG: conjugal transfer protein, partial [Streptosporangiaceae bacterium]